MISLARLLPLLVASAPLCSSFAPSNPSIAFSRAQISTLQSAASGETDHQNNHVTILEDDLHVISMERVRKATGSALVALTLSFFAITAPSVNAADSANIVSVSAYAGPSITIASANKSNNKSPSKDDATIQYMEQETRLAEKEAKEDAKKARVEKSREAFFDYDAKMAAQQEARIEAAEQKTLQEAKTDKELAQKLRVREQRAEQEAALATTPAEKAMKQKEIKKLLKLEQLAERNEKKAERAERIFLAEEEQEQKILKQKTDAARAEDKKFEAVEKEYKRVAELAKEDELELSLAKRMRK